MARDPFGWIDAVVDGKYRIESVVGEGGFGVVYAAQHLGFGTRVAVKCLKVPGHLDEADRAQFLSGFLAEGKLLHQLSRAHAGVVQALDMGAAESPGGAWTPYLVLEWLDGVTLEDDLAERARRGAGPRSIGETLSLFEGAAGALATAHEQSVAHRDVKPANLFLARVGGHLRTKVLDFGIAKVLTETTSLTRALSATGQSIRAFTPQYGAPEQFDPRFGATGPWTDVYAFALVLVEVVSGTAALGGSDTTQLYILSTDRRERPTPRTHGACLPDAVEGVFLRALQVEPRDRYRTLGEFWADLVAAAGLADPLGAASDRAPPASAATTWAPRTLPDALTTSASTTLPLVRTTSPHVVSLPPVAAARTAMPDVSIPPAPPARPRRRKGALVVVAGLVVAAGALGAAAWVARGTDTSASAASSPPLGAAAMGTAARATPTPAPVAATRPGMVHIAAAQLALGKAPGAPVTISRPFWIDVTEVTAGDYLACVKARQCAVNSVHSPNPLEPEAIEKYAKWCIALGDVSKRQYPINCIDRGQAAAYCAWAGKRLPTEAEWELAARGAEGRAYAWGDARPDCDHAVFSGLAGSCGRRSGPLPVRSAPDGRTPEGAYDMSGNVWEWVQDGWSKLERVEPTDPLVPATGARGVLRGGSWDFAPAEATARIPFGAGDGQVSTGVRCAADATAATAPAR